MEKQLIFEKISYIMSEVGVVKKDKRNTMQNYNFRGIDDMYNALNVHMAKAGVFVTSEVTDVKREERPSKQGGVLMYSILTMKFKFYAGDGSSVESVTMGEAMDSGDKSMNKAMSVAYKYALMQIFCIPTDEPKDPENDSPEPAEKRAVVTKVAAEESSLDKMPKTVNDVTYEWREGVYQGYPYAGWYPPKHMKQSKDNPDGLQKHDTDADMAQYIKDHGSNEDQAQLSNI
mgnify:FL=1